MVSPDKLVDKKINVIDNVEQAVTFICGRRRIVEKLNEKAWDYDSFSCMKIIQNY